MVVDFLFAALLLNELFRPVSLESVLLNGLVGLLFVLAGYMELMQKAVIDARGVHVRNLNSRSLPFKWKTLLWNDITAIAVSLPFDGPCYRGHNLVIHGKDGRPILVDVFTFRNDQRLAQMLIEHAWEHNTSVAIEQEALQQYGRPPFALGGNQ